MIVTQFASRMGQVVTVEPFSSRDFRGEISYGAARTYQARVVNKVVNVRDANGNEVVSRSHAVLMTADAVGPVDRFTMSTGWVDSTEESRRRPVVLATRRYPGTDGQPCYSAVYFE